MFNSFKLEKFKIEDEILLISINGAFKYKNHSKKPKIGILFDNGNENRRLPLIIKSFFFDSELEQCFLNAECDYELNNLFWEKNYLEEISLKFYFMYGGEYIDNLELDLSTNLYSDYHYYKTFIKHNQIMLLPNKTKLKEKQNLLKKFGALISFYNYILFIISILLIPFFAIDGLLAFKGFSEKSPDFKKNRRPSKNLNILFHINWKI